MSCLVGTVLYFVLYVLYYILYCMYFCIVFVFYFLYRLFCIEWHAISCMCGVVWFVTYLVL